MKNRMKVWILIGMIAAIWFTAGCEQQAEEPQEGIKLVAVKVETTGGQVIEKQADSEPPISEQTAVEKTAEKIIPPARTAPVVKMITTMGVIEIELYPQQAPQTAANFLRYLDDGFYNGTIFHRVISGFMIQGGGFTESMTQKPTRPPIINECGPALRNKRGTIAMARMTPPNSATCQFFINHKDNPSLDFDGPYAPGYAVFGKVVKGMEVVDRIARVQTARHSSGMADVPIQPVVIQRVERVR